MKDGQYSINENPVIFFWGDKSKTDLEFVEQQLDISKAFSPTIAYGVRSLIAGFCMMQFGFKNHIICFLLLMSLIKW